MNEIKEQQKTDTAFEGLSDPEVREAIQTLIQKLPKIKDAVLAAEQGLEFATSVMEDQQSVRSLFERAEEQMAPFRIEKESIVALMALMDKMPKILKLVSALEQVADLAESLMKDKQSQQYLLASVQGYIKPVTHQIDHAVEVYQEAKERSEQKQQPVSIFDLYRLLKDPAVQKGLRFAQSVVEVIGEKQGHSK